MKILKLILFMFALIIMLGMAVYAYYDGFKQLNFQKEQCGGDILIYEKLTGDYKQSAEAIQRIGDQLKSNHIESTKGFGLYYDNPQKVEKSKLRFEAGCILDEKDSSSMNELSQKFLIKIFPKGQYLTTEFPYKNSISIMVGVIKVYPAMNKYLKENGLNDQGPVMEIYDMSQHKIKYIKDINSPE